MEDLIDRNELMERLRKRLYAHNIKNSKNDEMAREVIISCMEAVQRSEQIDALKVVRCVDCKYYSLCGRPPFMFYQCTIQGATRSVDKDDFCKYGVLKE